MKVEGEDLLLNPRKTLQFLMQRQEIHHNDDSNAELQIVKNHLINFVLFDMVLNRISLIFSSMVSLFLLYFRMVLDDMLGKNEICWVLDMSYKA